MIGNRLRDIEPTFVVVCHAGDAVAATAAHAVVRLGDTPVVVVTAEELGLSARWSHRHEGGEVRTIVELPDGRVVDSASAIAVLNRLRYAVAPPFPRKVDREYALMEMFALLLSWLESLSCPVINRPSPRGLAGEERSAVEWLRLAARAGVETRRLMLTTDGRRFAPRAMSVHLPSAEPWRLLGDALHPAVPPGSRAAVFVEPVGQAHRALVVGETVFAAPDRQTAAGLKRLAGVAGCLLLEVEIARRESDGAWVVCGADSFPAVLADDEAEALAGLLLRAAAGTARQ